MREPLNLVMHDFGGHFGLAWAIRQPERVRPPLGETTEKGLYATTLRNLLAGIPP